MPNRHCAVRNISRLVTGFRKTGPLYVAVAGALLIASPAPAVTPAPTVQFVDEGDEPARVSRMALAPRLDKLPRIDGVIEPGVWGQAVVLAPLSCAESPATAPVATEVRVGCTDEAIFIALSCDEPEAARMSGPSPEQRDQRVWAIDGVEILVDSINDRRRPKGIAIAPTGALADFEIVRNQRNLGWESGAVAAAVRSDKGWTAEIAIPRNRLDDPANGVIGFNVIRRRLGSPGAPYTWNPAPPQYVESAEWMGNLSLDTPPVGVQQVKIGWPRVGGNRVVVRLRNDTRREQRVRLGVATRSGANAPDYSRYRITLPASKSSELALTHNIRSGGPHDFEFLMLDEDTGRRITWFARRNVQVNASAIEMVPQGTGEEGALKIAFRLMLPRGEIDGAVLRVVVREPGTVAPIAESSAPIKARMGLISLGGEVVGKELVLTVVRRQEMLARGIMQLTPPPELNMDDGN